METREQAFERWIEEIRNCSCCRNNFDDPEHYHSPVCSPDYKEIPPGFISDEAWSQ